MRPETINSGNTFSKVKQSDTFSKHFKTRSDISKKCGKCDILVVKVVVVQRLLTAKHTIIFDPLIYEITYTYTYMNMCLFK